MALHDWRSSGSPAIQSRRCAEDLFSRLILSVFPLPAKSVSSGDAVPTMFSVSARGECRGRAPPRASQGALRDMTAVTESGLGGFKAWMALADLHTQLGRHEQASQSTFKNLINPCAQATIIVIVSPRERVEGCGPGEVRARWTWNVLASSITAAAAGPTGVLWRGTSRCAESSRVL